MMADNTPPTSDTLIAEGLRPMTTPSETADVSTPDVFRTTDVAVYYGAFRAVRDVNLSIRRNEITAFIGPSGCGKSTMLRFFNRMNDLIPSARVEGDVQYHGVNLYDPQVNAVEVRRRIGMVFQKANPFPKSIFDNVAYGARLNGLVAPDDVPDPRHCRSVIAPPVAGTAT